VEDEFIGVLTSTKFLRENGIEIPEKGKEVVETEEPTKPKLKKK
jgi:hypothetical protein